MKINNIKVLAPAAALALAFSTTSCMKDLDDGNIDPTVAATVDVQGLYNKCYAGLIMEGNDGSADFSIDNAGKSTLLRNIYNFNELSTDEGICWWSDGGITEIGYNNCAPGHASLKFLYYRLMSNITFCNQFLSDEVDASEQQKAEIKVLRAYEYMLMLDFFGDAPFVEKIQTDAPLQAHAEYDNKYGTTSPDRKTMLDHGRKFLYEWCEAQLLAAEPNLRAAKAELTSSEDGYGCVDKATCWFLLSRLYLNAKVYTGTAQWQKAKDYAYKIMNCGGNFDLFKGGKEPGQGYTSYDMLFMGNNGESGASCEAILPLLQDGQTTKGWGGSLFFVASLWNDQMKTVNDDDAGTTGNTWAGMRVRPEFAEKFVGDAAELEGKSAKEIRQYLIDNHKGDDRCILWGKGSDSDTRTADLGKNSSFYEGLTTPKWNNRYSDGGTPHDSYDVDIDFFLFRYAEVLLNYAEADMRLNNETDTPEAISTINLLKDRAHASHVSKMTMDELLNERSRELYCEGIRRTDLIRFGQFGGQRATYKWSYKGGQKDGVNFDEFRNVYPLPTSEIDANSNLTQIYGY